MDVESYESWGSDFQWIHFTQIMTTVWPHPEPTRLSLFMAAFQPKLQVATLGPGQPSTTLDEENPIEIRHVSGGKTGDVVLMYQMWGCSHVI